MPWRAQAIPSTRPNRKSVWLAVTIGSSLVLAASSPSAAGTTEATHTYHPLADAYVSSAAPRINPRGRRLELDAQPVRRAYLLFKARGLPGTVSRATLRVFALKGSRAGFDVRAVGVSSWVERRITYRTAPRPGARIAASGPVTSGSWVPVDVTAAVQRNGTVSLALTTRSRNMIALASREAGPRSAPRLEIESKPALDTPAGAPAPATDIVTTLTPPLPTEPPVISGAAWATQVLTASPGAWTGSEPIAFVYQWQRCDVAASACAEITDATASTYTLSTADIGATVRVAVTASARSGSSAAISEPTDVVTPAPNPPAASKPPTISGTAREGAVLTARSGTWDGAQPLSLAYQWRRCDITGNACADIVGATTQTYTLASGDVGATIRIALMASNRVASATAASAPTKPVEALVAVVAGTIGLWHMDELGGTTMIDSSGHANHGNVRNVAFNQPGVLGGAYGFNGKNSVVTVPSKNFNPGARNFSFGLSLRFSSHPTGDSFDPFRKGYGKSSGGDYKLEIEHDGTARCYFKGSAGPAAVSGGGDLADGTWHRLKCVKTSNSIKLEIDGKTYSESASVGSISNGENLTIGARAANDETVRGVIDEASITIG